MAVDNYATHKRQNPGMAGSEPAGNHALHPNVGSWLNLVEVFFGIITRQAIRRGSFDSVNELVNAFGKLIAGWNDRCHPFTWTEPPTKSSPHP